MDIAKIAADHGISSDEVRGRWLSMKAAQWKSDFHLFCRDIVRIRTKEGDLEPLVLNEAQMILHGAAEKMLNEEGWIRIIGAKARRQGFSTYVAARGYWRAILNDRQNIYILTHEQTASDTLFGMVALMQEKNAFAPAVGTDNAKKLEFERRGSSYTVATAGQKAGGRGGEHFSSSVQSVDEVRGMRGVIWTEPENPLPFERGKGQILGWIKPPSEVWLESTSSGPTGAFWSRYMDAMKGKGRYRHVFVSWAVQREYREAGDFVPEQDIDEEGEISEYEYQQLHELDDAQMLWRRSKIQELGSPGKFRQEYPIDVTEAFSAADIDGVFIKPALVLRARKRKWEGEPDAPLVIGVDPAGSGGDRFALAYRRGDVCLKIKSRAKLEHDEAVAWLSRIIDEEKPERMNIDRGSMGAAIVTTLRNIDPKYSGIVRGVDFGGTSKAKQAHPKRAGPTNRRAEMYGDLNQWLKEGGCIPDDDDLASDLSGPKQLFRQNNDWILESKSDMKKRGIRSPDLSDALALTLAFREFFSDWNKPKVQKGFAVGVPRQGGDTYGNEFDDEFAGVETSWMMG